MQIRDEIYRRLRALGIRFEVVEHPLANTMEELVQVRARLNAVIPKNLFLTPRNQSAFYLCLVMPEAVFRTADISGQIGSSRLSFGPEDRLKALLRTHPGAISPMGLLFDEAREVRLLIDERLKSLERVAFHPNDNTRTLAMSGHDFFEVFLPAVGHDPTFVGIHTA